MSFNVFLKFAILEVNEIGNVKTWEIGDWISKFQNHDHRVLKSQISMLSPNYIVKFLKYEELKIQLQTIWSQGTRQEPLQRPSSLERSVS